MVAPMSFTPTPSSIGPETKARPTSPPTPWPRAFPALEYWLSALIVGCTGVGPPKMVSPVMNPPRRHHFWRSEEHTSELQSRPHLVCRLLLEKKKRHLIDAH